MSDDAGNEVAALRSAVHRLARRLRKQAIDELTPSRVSVLSTVERRGSVRIGDLARLEQVGNSTLTRLVAKLEAAGYITRSVDPDDARSAVIRPTDAGRAVLRSSSARQDAYLAAQLDSLEPAEKQTLLQAGRIIEKLLGYRT